MIEVIAPLAFYLLLCWLVLLLSVGTHKKSEEASAKRKAKRKAKKEATKAHNKKAKRDAAWEQVQIDPLWEVCVVLLWPWFALSESMMEGST